VVFLNTVYGKLKPDSPLRPWLWAGSLVAAGTVGYLRYDSGNHFPTDILAGAAIGGLAGWMVPRLHETGAPQVSIAPSADRATVLVSLPF
jgi:membrane-associated phospholipid phosphatase